MAQPNPVLAQNKNGWHRMSKTTQPFDSQRHFTFGTTWHNIKRL
jgi:hypothetical protein